MFKGFKGLTDIPGTDVIDYVNDGFRLRLVHDQKVDVAFVVFCFVVSRHNID